MARLTSDVEAPSAPRKAEKWMSSYCGFREALRSTSAHPSIQSIGWVIFPDNLWIQRWDAVVLWMLLGMTFILPYQLGVSGGAHLLLSPPWFGVNVGINTVFFVDTFVYFFRAYREPTGKLVLNLAHIRSRYLRTYFFPNLLSTFPSTVLFYSLGTKAMHDPDFKENFDISELILIKIFDLLKLIRLVVSRISMHRVAARHRVSFDFLSVFDTAHLTVVLNSFTPNGRFDSVSVL